MTWTTSTSDLWIVVYVVVISTMDVALALRDVRLTWSMRLRHYGRITAALPFAWAALWGHFWGPPLPNPWWSPLILAGLTLGLVAISHKWPHRYTWWQRACVGVLGVIAGGALWAQS